jgi:diaminopimelate epimerase
MMNLPIGLASLIPFVKMSGSGNDFVVVDNRSGLLPFAEIPSFTQMVCRRRLSIGADGVVLIERPEIGEDVDFRWRYINADGSDGEMCGNGAMCGARFAVLNGIARDECRFLTPSGVVEARVGCDPGDPSVEISINDPSLVTHGISVTANGVTAEFSAIQVGVPHAVTFVPNPDEFLDGLSGPMFNGFGRAVRLHEAFAPAGTNVNVVGVRDRHTLRMRTYERGVEDETLACGTGAVASAVTAVSLGLVTTPVSVIVSSGRALTVNFEWDGEQATNVTLGGNAYIIVRGTIGPDALIK